MRFWEADMYRPGCVHFIETILHLLRMFALLGTKTRTGLFKMELLADGKQETMKHAKEIVTAKSHEL